MCFESANKFTAKTFCIISTYPVFMYVHTLHILNIRNPCIWSSTVLFHFEVDLADSRSTGPI